MKIRTLWNSTSLLRDDENSYFICEECNSVYDPKSGEGLCSYCEDNEPDPPLKIAANKNKEGYMPDL